jgi:hypothetical protein
VPSLPYKATQFAKPAACRVRRDDLWTSASPTRLPSARVPSSRRSSACGANPVRQVGCNEPSSQHEGQTEGGELSRRGRLPTR